MTMTALSTTSMKGSHSMLSVYPALAYMGRESRPPAGRGGVLGLTQPCRSPVLVRVPFSAAPLMAAPPRPSAAVQPPSGDSQPGGGQPLPPAPRPALGAGRRAAALSGTAGGPALRHSGCRRRAC
jgi:hypothetical protein